MDQGKFRLKFSSLNLFNVGISVVAIGYGIISFSIQNFHVLSFIFGIPFYALYPHSMLIFGAFALFLSVKGKLRAAALPGAACAAVMFDFLGNFTSQIRPDFLLFILWMLPVFIFFIMSKVEIYRFVINPAFLGYIIFITYFGHTALIYNVWLEPVEEVVWCICFWIAFSAASSRSVSFLGRSNQPRQSDSQ